MTTSPIPVAVHAEAFGEGVIITFDDGRCAVYSMELLHRMFSEAQEIFDTKEDD